MPSGWTKPKTLALMSAVPVTATGHCPVPVLPRRAKTSFPRREAAPLHFAAPSAWVQRGSWAGLRSASASAVACKDQLPPLRRWLLCVGFAPSQG